MQIVVLQNLGAPINSKGVIIQTNKTSCIRGWLWVHLCFQYVCIKIEHTAWLLFVQILQSLIWSRYNIINIICRNRAPYEPHTTFISKKLINKIVNGILTYCWQSTLRKILFNGKVWSPEIDVGILRNYIFFSELRMCMSLLLNWGCEDFNVHYSIFSKIQ